MKNWTKHLIPNVGTLLIVGLLLLAQGVNAQQAVEQQPAAPSGSKGAAPSRLQGPLSPSSTLFSYQGQLLDADDEPVEGSVDMTFSLYHQESGGVPFWTEIYTGTQAITVTNGLFHVLLGSLTPIDPVDLSGDLYLELTVNGETLSPRELFTSVAYAVEAGTLPDGATTRGSLAIDGGLTISGTATVNSDGTTKIEGNLQVGGNSWTPEFADMGGNDLAVRGQIEQYGSGGARLYKIGVGADPLAGEGTLVTSAGVSIGGDLDMTEHDINNVERIESIASGNLTIRNSVGGVRFASENSVNIVTDNSDVPGIIGSFAVYKHSFTPSTRLFEVTESDDGVSRGVAHFWGQIDMHGHTVVNCGALVEANLQTEEEIEAGRIDRFEEGDVLCWGMDRLELCAAANDRLVQAVADSQGRPIVIGAEVVKVLGPVQRGDLLVASDVPGYAMVNNDPLPGSVIAQALGDFDGEMGIIKAMIRKW